MRANVRARRPADFSGAQIYRCTVTNMAARLCGEAKGGQILTNRRTLSQFEHLVEALTVGELTLKGFAKPVSVFSISTLN